MNADEFRDYILGFIFYKYLSEKIHFTANKILEDSGEKIDYEAKNEVWRENHVSVGCGYWEDGEMICK